MRIDPVAANFCPRQEAPAGAGYAGTGASISGDDTAYAKLVRVTVDTTRLETRRLPNTMI
jgi:hypothetical protein